ncbi:hypothetical protein D3C73_1257900 [compost metagenome]
MTVLIIISVKFAGSIKIITEPTAERIAPMRIVLRLPTFLMSGAESTIPIISGTRPASDSDPTRPGLCRIYCA